MELEFIDSLCLLSRIHWDEEPGRAHRRAGFHPPQYCYGGRVQDARRARQREWFRSVGVADGGRRDACPTLRFMESLHSLWRVRWDDEPRKAPASRAHSKRFAKSQALCHCAAAFG